MELLFAALTVGFLAYSNGANDNFKGVATLYGSNILSYRAALILTTIATLLGSVFAFILAQGLLAAFKGKGVIAGEVLATPHFFLAVGMGAAITVMLAARLGIPISTTHSIIGALVGAALMVNPAGIYTHILAGKFFTPLLISPFVAILGTALLYPLFRHLRRKKGINKQSCLCIGEQRVAIPPVVAAQGNMAAMQYVESELPAVKITVADRAHCREEYVGRVFGFEAERVLNLAHIASAALVSFARGVNDTPKIAAILIAASAISADFSLALVGLFIGIGGWLSSKRVAETVAHKVTDMNSGQGFTANLVTSLLVIGASRLGMPVSTTHVSVGSLFGLGAVTRRAHWKPIIGIVLAWICTLPLAAACSATLLWFLLSLQDSL